MKRIHQFFVGGLDLSTEYHLLDAETWDEAESKVRWYWANSGKKTIVRRTYILESSSERTINTDY